MMAGGRVFPPMRNSDQHDNGGPSPSDITQWLSTRKGEDSAALGKLLRLVKQDEMKWQNRAQFFALAAQMMRRILVSHARARKAAKRGGGDTCITLEEGVAVAPERDVNLLAIDEALTRLETVDPEKSRMVELRFFSGLSIEETAEVMGVSPRTIVRQWQTAKAWLEREIRAA